MSRDDFFNLSVEQRKSLIFRASGYYYVNASLDKIEESDVKEFMIMLDKEREAYEKDRFLKSLEG